MRVYYEVALRAFRRATTYRSAYVAGILTNAFFGALMSLVFIAVYGAGGPVAGLSLRDAISYTWATQSMIAIGGGWLILPEISMSIRTGDVISDLSRPWSFYGYWLARSLGERLFNLLLRGSLTYLVGVLYFGALLPTPGALLWFSLSIGLSLLLSFALSFCVHLTAFWLVDNSGLVLLANVLIGFFSGFSLPLAFFPPLLAAIANALPFRAITGLPAQILLGQIAGEAIGSALLIQLIWTVALSGLGLLMQGAAMRKVVIQGG
jgi:ABC-2 type transport system permease protein